MTKHNHITRDIKPLGECPSCDEYHDKHIPKRYLEYPAVIDWLQWGDFPEKLGDINYPQVTLTMIAEMRADLKNYQLEIRELKTKYDFQHLVKENDKLREQVKDYEQALEFYDNHESVIKEAYHSNEAKQITCVHTFINHKAREVLKKWSDV